MKRVLTAVAVVVVVSAAFAFKAKTFGQVCIYKLNVSSQCELDQTKTYFDQVGHDQSGFEIAIPSTQTDCKASSALPQFRANANDCEDVISVAAE